MTDFPEYEDLHEAMADIGARLERTGSALWLCYRDKREPLLVETVGWLVVRLCRGYDPLPSYMPWGSEARRVMACLGLTEGMRGQAELVDSHGTTDAAVEAVLDAVYLENGEPVADDISFRVESLEASGGREWWLDGDEREMGSIKVRFGPA